MSDSLLKSVNTVRVEQLKVADLVPYARNARTHSPEQVSQIAESIREFGFTNPVLVDAGNGIIAGHGRVIAAQMLGLVDLPCIRLGHLNETQRRAYVLADNRIALNSGWDKGLLSSELFDLQESDFDLSILGFSDDEISDAVDGPEPSHVKVWEVDDSSDNTWLFLRVDAGPECIQRLRDAVEAEFPGHEVEIKIDYRERM